jgi:hypothetical protein
LFITKKRYAVLIYELEGNRMDVNGKPGKVKAMGYGQAGKAKDGKDRIRPGTAKADNYCKRSNAIKGDWRSDPNSPNSLSRKKWKCKNDKSVK